MFSRLQYITDSPQLAEKACKAGVKWIQVRVKNRDEQTWTQIASEISNICKTNGVVCIVNDNLEIALKIGADGVHLGKKDMPVAEARRIIGNRKVLIGGSANTAEDVIKYAKLQMNYMGLGPLRFTSTKRDLNPVLGMDGYKKILEEIKKSSLQIPPVYAIGGIAAGDIPNLLSGGIYGVAVSSAISEAENMNTAVQEFLSALHEKKLHHEINR
jgi:thiamine-phosphate pyrophosphorylase